MITVQDLRNWYNSGVEQNFSHLIVVCDTFDYEDFPVYVKQGQDFYSKYNEYTCGKNMARIMEVYDLSVPFDKQKMKGGFAMSLP